MRDLGRGKFRRSVPCPKTHIAIYGLLLYLCVDDHVHSPVKQVESRGLGKGQAIRTQTPGNGRAAFSVFAFAMYFRQVAGSRGTLCRVLHVAEGIAAQSRRLASAPDMSLTPKRRGKVSMAAVWARAMALARVLRWPLHART